MSSIPGEHARAGQLASAISNLVVRVMREYTGRGPTQARAYIHDDLISVVVQDTLTKGERQLVHSDRSAVVLGMRSEYQDVMSTELVAGVQELVGREVIAFFSANHIEPDAALESFLLAPRVGSDGSADTLPPATREP